MLRLPSGQIVPDDPKIVDGDVRKLWAAGAFPYCPDIGRRRLQPLIDANVATTIQLNAGLLKPDPGGIRNAPRRDQYVAAIEFLLAGGRAHGNIDLLSGPAVHIEGLGRDQKPNTFVAENSLHFVGDVGILAAHQPGSGLDHGHAAPEAAVSLGQFEADITAAEHDQMLRQIIEFEGLDMGERPGTLETGNVRDCRVRSEVEENLVASQHARAAVIQVHLERFRRHKTPSPHDQFGAARFVVLQMQGNLAINHVALALANRRHVGRDRTGDHRAELCGVMR